MRLSVLVLILLALAACESSVTPTNDTSGVSVSQRMAATPDPGFARAVEPREFVFPADHGAHPDYATEWWYFTGNLRADNGDRYGYQLTLFRVGLAPGKAVGDSDWRAHQIYMGHVAISDLQSRIHRSAERFSRAAAGLAGAQTGPLRVWLGPWSITGSPDTVFPLRLRADSREFALDLTVQQGGKAPVLQGDRGLSRKGAEAGNASYYYSYTRLPTQGNLHIGDRQIGVSGDSWFDREWSSSALAPDQAGWDWFALQLDDGRELMYYQMRGHDGRPQRFSKGVLVAQDGSYRHLSADQVALTSTRTWRAPDGVTYPVDWRLKVPQFGLDLRVETAIDAQEMRHTVRYWEGAVTVSGSHAGRGYLELSGYAR